METTAIQRIKKRRSETGRRKAKARWDKDRARREALARRDPDRSRPIACRIIVIWDERHVCERTIYHDDPIPLARRKKREAMLREYARPFS